ncbi:target of Nesh-SH3 isoform X20 [Hemicordylus capensis]|uniref:target of Nesh-SH3 isoform X20 n=1 Tax=Hemicordylus capensis TaxID=884348 RepID=UPI0023040005|nr:target of Nesh-SH3 isoform X20 [Hemicordylus capensis]
MISRLVFLLFCGNIALNPGNALKLPRVKRQSLKVQINATDDAVCMRYIRPSPSTKLEGFILGYGSSFFSNQYIPLPTDGTSYITEVDAEPRYLIAVRSAPAPNYKKSCSGQTKTPKPLQLVIGTLTPTSVFLSWGILVNPKHDWTTMNNCANDRFYTVRYREKDKNKRWVFQLCPTTETVVDNLKPNTVYEFGVKDNTDNGIWSKIFNHKVAVSNKNKENGQNNYKLPKLHTPLIPGDSKALIPITIIKQVLQNITHRAQPKTPEKPPLAGPILVHLVIPDFNGTQKKLPPPLTLDISGRPRKTLPENETQEWPAESKTSEVQKISPQSQPAITELDWESNNPTVPSVSEESESSPAQSVVESSKPIIIHIAELPFDTLAPHKLPESPKTKTSPILQMPTETLASSEMQPVLSQSQTPAPKATQTKPAFSKTQLALSSPRTSDETDTSDSKPAPKVKLPFSSPKTTISPHVLHIKHDKGVTFRIEQQKTTIAPKPTRRVPARPKASPSPGIITTKPSSKGGRRVPSKPKTSPSPNVPQTKPVPKKTQPSPSKSKISSSTDIPEAGPAEIIHFPQEPITTMTPHTSERAKATLASTVEQFIPNKSKTTTQPRMLETKPALHQTTSQSLINKSTISSERHKATMVPKETRIIPSKPKTSGKPEVPQTKPAPVATLPGSINLHIHVLNGPKDTLVPSKHQSDVTTESPRLKTAPNKVYFTTAKTKTRPVVNKTTPAPDRTRTLGGLTWGKIPRGDKLTDQDATRLLSTSSSTSSNTSVDTPVTRKKPAPVATPPDSPRPPLAPAKPTPMRRKPLPPNTVTGKPGNPGNVLMPRAPLFPTASYIAKPSGPTTLTKTSSSKKPPTASSSPDYSNKPLFSSQPTTETDIAGKPRFTGEHVKYIKKDEDVPCSITETLQHFPTDDEENREVIAIPPQNPPTNLTVVTVEGCSTFVILDWEKPENDTVTEYKVVSTENGAPNGKDKTIITTNQTHSTVENLKPNTSYEFVVIPSNPLGEGPSSESKPFKTESADPRVSEPISMGKDAIWTEIRFKSDTYSECKGKQFVKRTWYKKFVGVQLCNSLRYKIYLSDSLTGTFYNIGDQRGHGEDHCQFVDSYLDGRTGQQLRSEQLPTKDGFFRAFRQEPVKFGKIGAETHTNYVHWYECGTTIPGKW